MANDLFSTPPLTGQAIRDALTRPVPLRTPIVHELLYRRKCTLLAADPGSGKSTICAQLAFSITAGIPVFGILEIPKPASVYYVAFETDIEEFHVAMKAAAPLIPFNPDMLYFDANLAGLNILEEMVPGKTSYMAMEKIARFKPDVIIIDPLYLSVAGDLADGKVASGAMRWFLQLAVRVNAAVLVVHHTHRERYDMKGKKVNEEDAIYGSRWLQAHAAVQWNMEKHDSGVTLKIKKDRYKLSRKTITLHYDNATGISSAEGSRGSHLPEQVFNFLKLERAGAEYTYGDLARLFDCAEGYLSAIMNTPDLGKVVEKIAPPGKPVIWRVKPKRVVEEPVTVGGEPVIIKEGVAA